VPVDALDHVADLQPRLARRRAAHNELDPRPALRRQALLPRQVGRDLAHVEADLALLFGRVQRRLGGDLDLQRAGAAVPQDLQRGLLARREAGDPALEAAEVLLLLGLHGDAVEGRDDVPGPQAGASRGRIRDDAVDDHAGLRREPEVVGQLPVEGLQGDAEVAAGDSAALELRRHLEGRVDGDREADSAALAPRVDADDVAVQVDEGPSRGAAVDHGVGLDEVVQQVRDLEVPAHGRDDSQGDGAVESVGVADRQHPLPDAHRAPRAEGRRGQRGFGLHAQQGDVGLLVRADELGGVLLLAPGDADRDLLGLLDHVFVGQDVAVRAHHDARPRHLAAPVVDLDDGLDVDHRRPDAPGDLDDAVLEPRGGVLRGGRPGRAQDREGQAEAQAHGRPASRARRRAAAAACGSPAIRIAPVTATPAAPASQSAPALPASTPPWASTGTPRPAAARTPASPSGARLGADLESGAKIGASCT
jgi:hypothetical protein